ncbi:MULTISPECIES: tRNA lysidine(34) synthetase TilS [Halomonadaceae]|uniref:tRNA(Ile)-lysidine synthase n=1 Tax=Vreelandella titanicae TaxID=664683 RepID=A0AAP9NRB1_9GAMM|nr:MULTISPECIES: tRNA lysidine(34) synthetase TilS [Halomonas]QKS26865.1 tRNA(Ile)-lysidine synthase [Halomonas titanicae]CDG51569.1 tRNA(Ile)-lysidine synthase [Halomonas sp. A3H3]SDI14809.1 tRNA(Ile)-lysidine synthase [Halomonas titanicae]
MAPQPLNTLQRLLNDALAETPPGRSIWVALSGGLDSCLLLALAARACEQADRHLRAIHINHGLQAAAQSFEAHCRDMCVRLNVPLTVVNVTVDAQGEGIEGAARNARYEAFLATIPTGDTLWLAQHQDDQAETFLLAALRGSGLRGLAGMPYRREAQSTTLVRPWLSVHRAELEAAAGLLELRWCEDPTNQDIRFDRNRLRHRILPALRERWPTAVAALANSATNAGDADAVLSEYLAAELNELVTGEGQIDASALSQRSRPRQRLLVRTLCQQQGLPTPPQKRLESLLDQLNAKAGAAVCVEWPGAQARLWRQRLYLMVPFEALSSWEVSWDGQTPLETPIGPLGWQVASLQEPSQPLRATWRQGGEVIQLPKRGRRDLKRLLQEADMPPWERQRLVVIMQGEACIGVVCPPAQLLWQAEGVCFTRLTSPA